MFNFDPTMILTVAAGLAVLYVLGQLLQSIGLFTSIKPEVLPADLKLGDRASVQAAVTQLGTSGFSGRVRNLLDAWSRGTGAQTIVQLAATQSSRAATKARATLFFAAVALAAATQGKGLAPAALTGLALAGVAYLLAILAISKADDVIESKLLSQLPGQIEGTTLTADAIAEALGGAIDKAFRNYVPQPDKLATAVSGSLENAVKSAASAFESAAKSTITALDASGKNTAMAMDSAVKAAATNVEAAGKKLAETQDALVTKWAAQQKETVGTLETAKKALETAAAALTSGLSGSADKWQNSLTAHAGQVTAANQALAAQLEKIQALGKEIEKVLHVQLAVDNTIKSVTTTEEFRTTLVTLKKHLEQSDNLLREISKPRMIRLVENEV